LTARDKKKLEQLDEKIEDLPTGETPEDIEAMDIIRRAAKIFKEQQPAQDTHNLQADILSEDINATEIIRRADKLLKEQRLEQEVSILLMDKTPEDIQAMTSVDIIDT